MDKVRIAGSDHLCLEQQVPVVILHPECWPGSEERKFTLEQADRNLTWKTISYRKREA